MYKILSSTLTATMMLLTVVGQLAASPLQEGQKLVASDTSQNGFFGASVDTDGDTVVVGTLNKEAVYVYNNTNGVWVEVQKITSVNGSNLDDFGFSLSLDGQRMVIGSPNKRTSSNFTDVGTAYVFELMGGQWVETHQFIAPVSRGGGGGQSGENFGYSVSLAGDRVAIGAPNNSNSSSSGSVYVYEYDGTQWMLMDQLAASDTTVRNQLGWDIQLLGDRVFVGAPWGAGAVYEFTFDGLDWLESQKMVPLDPPTRSFGISLDVSSDVLVIGATSDNSMGASAGAAFVLEPDQNDNWVQTQELFSSDIMPTDQFGFAVDIQDSDLLVTSLKGRAYLFKKVANGWQEAKILVPSEDVTNDLYGFSGVLGNGFIMVGSIRSEDGTNMDEGAVFTFINDLIFNNGFE